MKDDDEFNVTKGPLRGPRMSSTHFPSLAPMYRGTRQEVI